MMEIFIDYGVLLEQEQIQICLITMIGHLWYVKLTPKYPDITILYNWNLLCPGFPNLIRSQQEFVFSLYVDYTNLLSVTSRGLSCEISSVVY